METYAKKVSTKMEKGKANARLTIKNSDKGSSHCIKFNQTFRSFSLSFFKHNEAN